MNKMPGDDVGGQGPQSMGASVGRGGPGETFFYEATPIASSDNNGQIGGA